MPRISDPIRIGKYVKLKNRFVNAPMYRCFGVEEGYIHQEYIDSYAAEARGGPGMIVVANTAVSKDGVAFRRMPHIHHDSFIPGLADLAYQIHLADVKAAVQLFHGGIICTPPLIGGQVPVGPSEVPLPFAPGLKARRLSDADIERIIEEFGQAAARAKQAGFDAVNVHAAHGASLIMQFTSPVTNKREDKWGWDRLLLSKRILKSIREHTDPDFPIIWRISAEEYAGVEGYGFEFVLNELVPALDKAGVDVFDVSTGGVTTHEALAYLCQPVYFPSGTLVPYAEAVKRITKKPVATVGKLFDPKLVRRVVEEGKADIVQLGRVVTADPDFPRKVLEGRDDDIRRCMSENWCLQSAFFAGQRARCAQNACYGREREYGDLKPALKQKKIMVIGGGPAGMEFARIAVQRGHEVTLYEKKGRLGGLVHTACAFPHLPTRHLYNSVSYLKGQLEKLAVKVVLNKEVTAQFALSERPDAVIVATGSLPHWPDIEGILKPIVLHYEDYLSLRQYPMVHDRLIRRKERVGSKVVVIGGVEGAETSLSLARSGKDVTLVEKTDNIVKGPYLLDPSRIQMLVNEYMPEAGVKLRLNRKAVEITDDGVTIIDKDGNEEFLPADTVVVTCGRVPNEFLKEALIGKIPEVHAIGDCIQPRNIGSAIHEGAFWARQV
jgi:2,4-dienoyl-CoA reductase-like NADH-dependent reductase (Old Yellow Enzyme family)/thioredoxin reductase